MNDSRWVVDTTWKALETGTALPFDFAMNSIIPQYDYGDERYEFWKEDETLQDFIIELVAEIERLQTQVIEQHDTIERLDVKLSYYEMSNRRINVNTSLYRLEKICEDAGWFEDGEE